MAPGPAGVIYILREEKMSDEKREVKISNDFYTMLKAEFFDSEYIIEPEYYNCRIDKGGQRFYVRYFPDGSYIKAPSFSEVMNKVLGVNYYLAQWLSSLSKEQAEFESINSANYGTYLHILFGEIIRKRSVVLHEEWFQNDIEEFCTRMGYDYSELSRWYKQKKRKVCDDVIGFICWLKEYDVKPIAMEYPLMHPAGLWAGTCDLICKLTIKDKEIIAMVDFKSSLKVFFESHEIQLYAYSKLWNLEFPDLQIERVFNYGCNEFKRKTLKKFLTGGKSGNFKPYRFQDQTDSPNIYKWDQYIVIYHGQKENLEFSTTFEYDMLGMVDRDSDLSDILLEYDVIEGLIDKIKTDKISENKEVQEIVENLEGELKNEK